MTAVLLFYTLICSGIQYVCIVKSMGHLLQNRHNMDEKSVFKLITLS